MSRPCARAGCTNSPQPRSKFCLADELDGVGNAQIGVEVQAVEVDQQQSVFIGPAILARRAELSLSQAFMAHTMNMHVSSVALWDKNKRPVPANRLDALAEALDVTVEWLVAQSGEEAPHPPRQVAAVAEPAETLACRGGLERLAAYTLHPLSGPSPVPGRPRAA